jgi:Ribosomal RNA methyltransferase (FmrO)
MNKIIFEKIREKREFSQLPEKDIELAYEHFEKRQVNEEEKIKLTRGLLRKIFSAFLSKKLLSLKNKEPEWILRKHISTRERLPYYEEIYKRIFNGVKKASVVDLGSGINGFSYNFFKKLRLDIDYISIESVGQLVELMNFYFNSKKIKGKAIHLSLFEKEKVKKIITEQKKPRIIFLFKVIDALESLKKDYSKTLIEELIPISDKIIISFATRSLGNREKFKAKRNWIVNFIKENFTILDDFEIGGERYIIFNK